MGMKRVIVTGWLPERKEKKRDQKNKNQIKGQGNNQENINKNKKKKCLYCTLVLHKRMPLYQRLS